MSVNDNFSTFCSNLAISSESISKIKKRYHKVTRIINSEYRDNMSETAYSWYVGSFGRGMEIWSSNIEILVQLPCEIYKKFDDCTSNGQSILLQDVKNVLQKTFSDSHLKDNGQAIEINFNDEINLEIVPAFINNYESFTYPNSHNGGYWKTMDPKKEIIAFTDANSETNMNLKFLCKMMRSWKAKCSVPISDLLIDTLALDFISTWQYKHRSYLYYDYMSRDFFLYLKNINQTKENWLAPGSNECINKSGDFQTKASIAYHHALDAIEYENNGMLAYARSKWKNIYGSMFS